MLLSNEYSSNVEFYLILATVVVVVEIKRGSVRNVEKCCEHDLAFCAEVNPVHRRVGLFAHALIKVNVVIIIDVILLSQPKSFISIDLFPFENCLFYLLSCLFFGFILHLDIIIRSFRCLSLSFLNLNLLLVIDIDREIDELRVPFDLF